MNKKIAGILTIATLVFINLGYICPPAYGKGASESPIHEMPKANTCSVITLHIRDLAFSLHQVAGEISEIKPPVRPASKTSEVYNRQLAEYQGKLKLLQEKKTSLRRLINIQEQQLENCRQHPPPPE